MSCSSQPFGLWSLLCNVTNSLKLICVNRLTKKTAITTTKQFAMICANLCKQQVETINFDDLFFLPVFGFKESPCRLECIILASF